MNTKSLNSSKSSVSFIAISCDRLFTLMAWLLGIMGFLLPVAIVFFVFFQGVSAISWEFLTKNPAGFPLGSKGGIFPAIQGSLALVFLGLLVALPFGIGGAIYLTEYGGGILELKFLSFVANCMAGVPAILYGLFGYALLVLKIKLNISLLAGSLTLALMMIPIILIGTEAAFKSIDPKLREAALSLGVTRAYVLRRIILVKAWPGILAVIVLAASHAFGTAAPLLYTASVVYAKDGLNLDAPVMTLPTHLYQLVSEVNSTNSNDMKYAYGTAFVLMVGLLFTNLIVIILKKWIRR